MKNLKLSVLALSMGLMSFTVVPVLKSSVAIAISNALISWESESLDLGNIPQNKPKTMEFVFKNDSKTVVKITKVQGSCGCTATDYTKTDIQPGKTGKISATFNAANKGAFTKTVSVTTTADEQVKVLTFKGIVI